MADQLKDYFAATMRADSTIRTLTGKATPEYGVYYQFPYKINLAAPLITFKSSGRLRPSDLRQDIVISITAWGDNFYDLHVRVYALFHNKQYQSVGADYRILSIKWIGSSPELWDDKLQCFYREDRYQIITAKD